jgi:RNA polymerase sigma factor (sigma-70 family)
MGLTFWLSAAAFAVKFSIDEHFLSLLRRGDQKAMSELIARHHGALVRLADSIVRNRAVAEEVAQETWLAVIANLGSFEGRSALSTWIISILLNKAKNHAKRESRYAALGKGEDPGRDPEQTLRSRFDESGHWSEAPVSFDGLTPERIVAGRHLWEHVRQMIDRLPPAQKAVLVMRDVEGADAAETCRLLDLTPENQRTLLHRARTRIRDEIETQPGMIVIYAAVRSAASSRKSRSSSDWATLKRKKPLAVCV